MVLPWNEAPGFTHLPCKILLGGISFMPTKFLLYFHEKEMLKPGRVRYVKSFKNEILNVTYWFD